MPDLETSQDIQRVVHRFYASVRDDADLGPLFAARLRDDDWPAHLDTMTRFWSSIVFSLPLYHGNPLVAHRGLPLARDHFTRWLGLWRTAVAEEFEGPRADDIVARATRIASVLAQRLEVA